MRLMASSAGVKMSGQCEQSVWDFALAWYAQSGVESDCLTAQNEHGLDVTALIAALYRSKRGEGFVASDVAARARSLSIQIIEPLRAARTALKAQTLGTDPDPSMALRQRIKAAELDAERLTLDALLALPVEGEVQSCEEALLSIARASQIAVTEDLVALLKRLASAAKKV
jgi:uncharacterized protein (TIGR02444 family)